MPQDSYSTYVCKNHKCELIAALLCHAVFLGAGIFMLVYTGNISSDQMDGFISETTGYNGAIHITNQANQNYTCFSVQCARFTPTKGQPPCVVTAQGNDFVLGKKLRYYKHSDQVDGFSLCSTKNPLYSPWRVCTLIFGIILVVFTFFSLVFYPQNWEQKYVNYRWTYTEEHPASNNLQITVASQPSTKNYQSAREGDK